MSFRSKMQRIRVCSLNLRHSCEIIDPAFIAWSARFDFSAEGFNTGGSVRTEQGLRVSHGAIISPYGGSVTLGRRVYVGPYSVLYGHGGLVVGDDVLIASHVTIIPSNHRFSEPDKPIAKQGATSEGIQIGNDVWIGSGARILDGVRIADGAVVAAGAVVTKSIAARMVVAGVPARVVGQRAAGAMQEG